ncbi:MAG: Ig-like domain repeat protein [Armatimonadota bacterium]
MSMTARARWSAILCVSPVVALCATLPARAQGVPSFGGNAQHTSLYAPAAQRLGGIKWARVVDENVTGFAHYGAPLVTAAGTVVVGAKVAGNTFSLRAYELSTGRLKWSIPTGWLPPAHSWFPVYNPVLAAGPSGPRLWFAGPGGLIWHIDDPDSDTPGAPVRHAFQGDAAYDADPAGYAGSVFVNTPLTAGTDGSVYFGYRVQGTAPAPVGTGSGFVRIAPGGAATEVKAATAAGDAQATRDSHNSAPALSADGSTLYVVAKSGSTDYRGWLVALDANTLAPKGRVFLTDPRNGNGAGILEESTSSPTVAPDGDVYLGIFANPWDGSRGFLRRFSADLSVSKTTGGFGWDYTPAIVPASMVPSYKGASPYLIFAKYNNYALNPDGDGVNRIALLDPNATQVDAHPGNGGLVQMREVLSVISPTPDPEHFSDSYPHAAREWCINAAAVNPATNSVFVPCEDGRFYRWDLATNALSETVSLNPGIGQPYVPTVVATDGTLVTMNGGNVFAIGEDPGVRIELSSSRGDLRTVLAGDALTFTASVAGGASTPTGTVRFTAATFRGEDREETVLGEVALDRTGTAALSTTRLVSGGLYLGGHFITATYSGDASHPAATTTRFQRVHGYAAVATVSADKTTVQPGESVRIRFRISGRGPVPPSGQVALKMGDRVFQQKPVGPDGALDFDIVPPLSGTNVTVESSGDTLYAMASASIAIDVRRNRTTRVDVVATPTVVPFQTAGAVTATVVPVIDETPTGSIQFREGSTNLGPAVPLVGGKATLRLPVLAPGPHRIGATFQPTGDWLASIGFTDLLVAQDGVPPTAPTGLVARTGKLARRIDLTWKASTDNVGVVAYDVLASPVRDGKYVRVGTTSATRFSDSLPGPAMVRWYRIVARDAAGNSSAPSDKAFGISR